MSSTVRLRACLVFPVANQVFASVFTALAWLFCKLSLKASTRPQRYALYRQDSRNASLPHSAKADCFARRQKLTKMAEAHPWQPDAAPFVAQLLKHLDAGTLPSEVNPLPHVARGRGHGAARDASTLYAPHVLEECLAGAREERQRR